MSVALLFGALMSDVAMRFALAALAMEYVEKVAGDVKDCTRSSHCHRGQRRTVFSVSLSMPQPFSLAQWCPVPRGKTRLTIDVGVWLGKLACASSVLGIKIIVAYPSCGKFGVGAAWQHGRIAECPFHDESVRERTDVLRISWDHC